MRSFIDIDLKAYINELGRKYDELYLLLKAPNGSDLLYRNPDDFYKKRKDFRAARKAIMEFASNDESLVIDKYTITLQEGDRILGTRKTYDDTYILVVNPRDPLGFVFRAYAARKYRDGLGRVREIDIELLDAYYLYERAVRVFDIGIGSERSYTYRKKFKYYGAFEEQMPLPK